MDETPQETGIGANETKGAVSDASKMQREKTEKEQALDSHIAKRQEIIEKLKIKNVEVSSARKRLSELIPTIRGKGSSRAMKLMDDAERLEFSIATEAYTPKKEKEMIKRLREIKGELSAHKELEEIQKKVDAERSSLRNAISDVKSLERELAEVRHMCDAAYAEVVSERKAAYQQREKNRQERSNRRFEDLRTRVHSEKKRQYDEDVQKYMKDYDDTVSMEEICVFEKKEKKKSE